MTFATNKFLHYIITATIVMTAEFLMSLSDTIVCGHIIGEEGLSAINLLLCVFEVVTFSSLMVMVGSSSLYSSEIGASRESKAHGYFTLGFIMSCVIGLFLALIVYCVREPFLSSFDVSDIVRQYAHEYLIWYLPAIILEPVLAFFSMMCYADGNVYLTAAALIAQLILNFVASVFLTKIYGPAGAAMGSAIAAFFALLILFTHFKTKACSLKFSRDFEARGILQIFAVSIGDASKNICRALLMLSLTYFIIEKFGAQYLPILSVVVVLIGLSEAFDGVSIAFQPLLSVYFGEGNIFLIKRIMRVALFVAFAEGVFLSAFFAIYPQIPLSIIALDDPNLIPYGLLAVRLSSCVLLGLALTLLFNSYFAYIRREALSTVLTVLSMFVSPLLLAVVFGTFFRLNGVWIGIGISPFVALAIIAVYILLRFGVDSFPFILSSDINAKVKIFDLNVQPIEICNTAQDAKAHLLNLGVSSSRASRVALLIEDIERSWEYKQRLEEGDVIDVNRYLDGHEKFWCGVKRSWRTKQVIRVYTGAGGNCGRSKKELAICGAVAVTLTEILESIGIGVELWSISPTSGLFTNRNDGQTLIKLKGSDEFADLGMINYITGNDTVFRNGVFRSWAKLAEREGFTLDCGLGRIKTPTAKDIGLEDCEADTAIIVPQMFDVATAKKWLLNLMKALPSKMNGKKEGE